MAAEEPLWITVQQKTFTKWVNSHLSDRGLAVQDLCTDLNDGIMLINLLEIISNKTFPSYNKKCRFINQRLENLNACLKFLRDEDIKLVAIGSEDIERGTKKLILGLIWTIILRYHIQKGKKDNAKNALLEWVRSKIPEYDIKNFDKSWSDGLAICALCNALRPDTVDMEGRSPADAYHNADDGIGAAAEKMDIPPVFDAESMVAAADELSCMTYISYFRSYEDKMLAALGEEARRAAEEKEARTADPLKCKVTGDGIKGGEVAIPATFRVTARNKKGEDIPVGGADVGADIVEPDGTPLTDIDVKDNGDGTYDVTYVPRVPGKHQVTAKIDGKPINHKPYTVPIAPARPDPAQSWADGPGVEGGVPAGAETPFTVHAVNAAGAPMTTGGHPFTCKVTDPRGKPIRALLKDNGDGTYAGTYTPEGPGDYTVEVICGGAPIKDSPFTVPITPDESKAHDATSWAEGPGIEPGHNTADDHTVTIHAVNPAGVPLDHGGDPFRVQVTGPDGAPVPSTLKDNGDGTYTANYEPTAAGPHTVDIALQDPLDPSAYKPIKDAPFTVDLAPGFDAAHSTCEGPGVDGPITDTDPAVFTVRAKDIEGNDVAAAGLPLKVTVTGPDGKELPADIKDNGDGTYDVEYNPTDRGEHKVEVSVDGKPVGKSPYTLEAEAGVDTDNSSIKFMFSMQLKTKSGGILRFFRRTNKVTVDVTNKEVDYKGEGEVQDLGEGMYKATYEVPGSGLYKVNVKLNGRRVKGSPFKQNIP